MAEQFDVLAVLDARRRGELTLREWWSSARSPTELELGWLDRADLAPAAMLVVRSLVRWRPRHPDWTALVDPQWVQRHGTHPADAGQLDHNLASVARGGLLAHPSRPGP
jgi:hypothetical protein